MDINWDALSAIGTILATAFAGFGLVFTAVQIRQSTRSSEFDTLTRLETGLIELEDLYETAQSSDPDAARRARNRFYNRLEILASGVRHKMLGPQGHGFVENLLIDLVAWEEHTGGHTMLGQTQGEALEDVEWFVKQYRERIDHRKAQYRRQEHEA